MKKYTKVLVLFLSAAAVLYAVTGCSPAPAASHAPGTEAPAIEAPTYQAAPTQAPALEAPTNQAAPSQAPALCPPGQNSYVTPQPYDTSSEEYGEFIENGFKSPAQEPLSTFSIDVDTASYSNIRRYIEDGMLPPTDAVRLEECVNYFPYSYEAPESGDPVNVGVTISDCPWNSGRCLARVSLKARELGSERTASNLVFLLDVSGSMGDPNKLPLVKHAIGMLTENISNSDRISIVVYASSSGVVLEGCSGENKAAILDAVDGLYAGGSTAGAAGIELAYNIARKYYLEGGNNRVILCTDGDFNVGMSSPEELEDLIAEKSKSGVFLSVLGFGTGNVKDNRMETLADKGNGNYGYIDSESEAEKVFDKELFSTLFAVAKDVKVQVEFNPDSVKEYRLLGYDNRMLNPEDFNNDNKDAGEMGAGSSVTAFYEIIPVNSPENSDNIDDLVFQDDGQEIKTPASNWLYVKVRYKQPDSDESRLITVYAGTENYTAAPDDDFRFASAVAEFALLLKDSEFMGEASFSDVISRAMASLGSDEGGYRSEFLHIAGMAGHLE